MSCFLYLTTRDKHYLIMNNNPVSVKPNELPSSSSTEWRHIITKWKHGDVLFIFPAILAYTESKIVLQIDRFSF